MSLVYKQKICTGRFNRYYFLVIYRVLYNNGEREKRFDADKTVTVQEILEDYAYTNKTGGSDKVQIAVTVKADSVTATIDFRDAAQYENFVCPVWLI